MLIKDEQVLKKEENNLVKHSLDKEMLVSELQSEVMSIFDEEKRQHKRLYWEITQGLKDMLAFKQDYDALRLTFETASADMANGC